MTISSVEAIALSLPFDIGGPKPLFAGKLRNMDILLVRVETDFYDRFREYRNKGAMGIPRDELLGYMDEIAEALDIMTIEHDLLHLDIKQIGRASCRERV